MIRKMAPLVFASFVIILAAALIAFFSYDLLFFSAFVLVVATLVYNDRKKVRLEGVMFIRRTRKGKEFIDSLAKSHRKFWNALSIAGIIVSVIAMVYGTYFLVNNALGIMNGEVTEGARLVLPSPSSQVQTPAGFLLLPWWTWVIGIAFVIIPHEFMHGIMCRIEKVRIKSLGWILLLIIPGAFVEPDERQLQRMPRKTKLKVYAAGSFANFLVAFLMLVIMLVSFNLIFQPSGATAFNANESSVFSKNLSGFIISIDGSNVSGASQLQEILSSHKPGDTVSIDVSEKYRILPNMAFMVDENNVTAYKVTLIDDPEQPGKVYSGISLIVMVSVKQNDISFLFYDLIYWIYVLSSGIGIVNILPIKPLDGGLMFETIIGKRGKIVAKIVSAAMVAVLLFNLVGPMVV